jgi:predicted GNAT family acetyltransferase
LKNEKIVSFASAPHILTHKSFSFAILRGIETKLLERKQGYALETVGVLCQELFSQYHLKNIFSWVEEKNAAARSLYKKLGFREKAKTFAIHCDRKKMNF